MNLANKLTVTRLLVLPLIVLFSLWGFAGHWISVFFLSLLACLTDLLDGYVARRQGTVTAFGKAMDPIADKALFFTLALPMAVGGIIPWWIVWVFLMRELLVSGLRIASTGKRGEVIAASFLGKAKTVLQDAAILLLAAEQALPALGKAHL